MAELLENFRFVDVKIEGDKVTGRLVADVNPGVFMGMIEYLVPRTTVINTDDGPIFFVSDTPRHNSPLS